MRIHLDTNSLIDVAQESKPCHVDELGEELRTGGHKLVLSVFNVLEISAPLVYPNAKTNVMTLLNHLERLPIEFISAPKTILLELREALEAFRTGRDYGSIQPYSERFDATVTLWGQPSTAMFVNFGLSDTVFTLWAEVPDLFSQAHTYKDSLQRLFEADRRLPKKPRLSDNFVKALGLDMLCLKIAIDPEELDPFANWVYADSRRCPAKRLGYEAYHQILQNTQDVPGKGDIGDFAQLTCTPYADMVTFERRMGNYAKQACRAAGLPYDSRVIKNVSEILAKLRSTRS